MIKIVSLLSAFLFVSVPHGLQAASGDQDFYKGKTIRIIVGFAAGGGFDVLFSNHRSAHAQTSARQSFNDRR